MHNFRTNQFLRLSPNKSEHEINTIMVMCNIMIVVLAYSNNANPISSMFFENGRLDNNFAQRFKDLYIISSEPIDFLQYSKKTLENFDNLISNTFQASYAKGSTFKCSCGYIYFIDHCGGPTELGTCLFCKQTIGGQNHQIHQRPGHENLTHDEAREFLRRLVQTLETQTSKGCKNFKNLGENMHIRGLKPITSQFLHLILGTSLYFMLALDLIKLDSIIYALESESIQDLEDLRVSIENDIRKIQVISGNNESHC